MSWRCSQTELGMGIQPPWRGRVPRCLRTAPSGQRILGARRCLRLPRRRPRESDTGVSDTGVGAWEMRTGGGAAFSVCARVRPGKRTATHALLCADVSARKALPRRYDPSRPSPGDGLCAARRARADENRSTSPSLCRYWHLALMPLRRAPVVLTLIDSPGCQCRGQPGGGRPPSPNRSHHNGQPTRSTME